MPNKPTNDQRLIAHLMVGVAGAVAGHRVAGVPGLVFGAVVPPLLHEMADAPLADVLANVT